MQAQTCKIVRNYAGYKSYVRRSSRFCSVIIGQLCTVCRELTHVVIYQYLSSGVLYCIAVVTMVSSLISNAI